MITRENLKLLVVAVACLLVAWTGPSFAHGVHTKFVHNADKVDGKHAVGAGSGLSNATGKLVAHNGQGRLSAKFLPGGSVTEGEYTTRHATVVTTHGPAAWRAKSTGFVNSSEFATSVSPVDGGTAILPLQGPRSASGLVYGLDKVEICYESGPSSFIERTRGFVTDTQDAVLFTDETDRTSTSHACYSVPVGSRVLYGAQITVTVAGGPVSLKSVRATWTTAAAHVAPSTTMPSGRTARDHP